MLSPADRRSVESDRRRVCDQLAARGVSRETLQRLQDYVDLLIQWQNRINLISPRTITEIWSRHILDSVQLAELMPAARHWVDLGSGGGLPGLVLGCILAGQPGSAIHLVESNGKKSAFLRHVATTLALPVHVHGQRIEEVIATLPQPQVITARALASLDVLIGYSNLLLKSGAIGLFPKGREFDEELTAAQRSWHFSYALRRSVTDSEARIIEISMA